jgi:hypothetical protein
MNNSIYTFHENWFNCSRVVRYRLAHRPSEASIANASGEQILVWYYWVKCLSLCRAAGFQFSTAVEMFLLATTLNLILQPLPIFPCVKWPERNVGHEIESAVELKNRWSSPLYAFSRLGSYCAENRFVVTTITKNLPSFLIRVHKFWTL